MEFIELGEFYKIVEEPFQVSESQAFLFFNNILRTLKYIHSKQIYHLDLKPENILMDSKGELFLCDFGNSLNKKAKPNWKKLNFCASDMYSCPEQNDLELL